MLALLACPPNDAQGKRVIHLVANGGLKNNQPLGREQGFERVSAKRSCRNPEKGKERTK